jgi:hypothetical protein
MLLLRVWEEQPGKYFFLSTKNTRKEWKDHAFSRDQFEDVADFIKENQDKDIYFCPHGFTRAKRRKDSAVLPSCLYADLDAADPRTIKFKPTIAIESSPGRFVGLWITDKPITEELNRRLAYAVGADTTGWDLTQVLRVPGTTNFKYNSLPRVRLLWQDGPTYKISDLEKKLPVISGESSNNEESDAASVYKKWERRLPLWVRRELMATSVKPGKRSEMIWKLETTLLECGVSVDEAFLLIKASKWNKFSDRRNGDEQLRKELDKVINNRLVADRPQTIGEPDRRLVFRTMEEITEEHLDWLWFPYIARGELSILEGDPGRGKSYLMQIVARAICDGIELPTVGEPVRVTGRVVYFDLENSAGSVTKPRLMANGLRNLSNFVCCEEPFSIEDPDALDEVYEYLEQTKPTLVVFDTLNTYLGKTDAYKGHEAQQTMVMFRELAKRFNCAVVVLRHLTKSSKGVSALYRGQGSISLAGLARVVMTVGGVPGGEEEDRAMIPVKLNVAAMPPALTFRISKYKKHSRFTFLDFKDLSASELLSYEAPKDEGVKPAQEFLKEVLDDGGIEEARLMRMAEARSIDPRSLKKAAEALNVWKAKRKGKTIWALDQPDADD